jgi:enoyl-CoA hydratase/carnithine racemase
MEFSTIILEKKEGVARITLNRPEKLNAINSQLISDLYSAIQDIERDDSVRVVVITGSGRAFSAGADLEEIGKLIESPVQLEMLLREWRKTFDSIENLGKPVIAAINGMALAGGLELVMACDIAIASQDAKIGDQHANFGLIPGGGNTQRLPRAIGARRAKYLILTGEWISADEAERIGLVNKVVPASELDNAVKEITDKLVEKSPMASRAIKFLVNRGIETDLATGLDLEIEMAALHIGTTEDSRIGIQAFKERKKPIFKGK